MRPTERALIRSALPSFVNFMRILHPGPACAAKGVLPQQSWVGMGPCCIVKGKGGLCLVLPLAQHESPRCHVPCWLLSNCIRVFGCGPDCESLLRFGRRR